MSIGSRVVAAVSQDVSKANLCATAGLSSSAKCEDSLLGEPAVAPGEDSLLGEPAVAPGENSLLGEPAVVPGILIALVLRLFVPGLLAALPAVARAAQVSFDMPEAIECRDATPESFAAAHADLKVIEAVFRISARLVDGGAADIVDFEYTLTSDNKTLRFQDYLPNTILESSVADDQIEISDSSEKTNAAGAEAHVAYKIFNIGATANQSSKKSQCSHYKQIAAKELVLASGTINREHGVFYRLRPSRLAALEGAKEFTFLATVPKQWRGDLCTITCSARSKKKTTFSTSIAPAGTQQAQVGMYLVGDVEAVALARKLAGAEEAYAAATAGAAKINVLDTISGQTVGLFTGKNGAAQARQQAAAAQEALRDARQRIVELAK